MSEELLYLNADDVTGLLAADGGYTVERFANDGPNTGRLQDLWMDREFLGVKSKLQVNCKAMTEENARRVLFMIDVPFVHVTYRDPLLGIRENVEMYCTQTKAAYVFRKPDGSRWWKDISFNLIER